MPQPLKSLLIVVTVIVAWAGTSALFGSMLGVMMPCMSLGVFMSGLFLLIASNHENNWKRLTWQPYNEEESSGVLFMILVGFPVTILAGGLFVWLGSLISSLLFGLN